MTKEESRVNQTKNQDNSKIIDFDENLEEEFKHFLIEQETFGNANFPEKTS